MTELEPVRSLREQLDAVERRVLLDTLTLTQGSRVRAARLLQLSLRNLFYKLRKHQIRSEDR